MEDIVMDLPRKPPVTWGKMSSLRVSPVAGTQDPTSSGLTRSASLTSTD